MSEVVQEVGDPSKDQGSAQSGSEKDTVSYQTYKKAVSEVKKLKEQMDSLLSEKDQQQQAILAEQGKYKEIAEKIQKDLKAKDDEIRRKESFFVQQNLKQTVARYAKELGAKDEAIDELFAVGSAKDIWKSIEVKDDYSIDGDQVKKSLEEMSQKSPWFFAKQANPPKDVVLGSGVKDGKENFSAGKLGSLNQEQLTKLLAMKLEQKK